MKLPLSVFRPPCVLALFGILPAIVAAQGTGFTGAFDPGAWIFSSGGSPANVVWNDSSSFTLTGSNAAAGTSAFSSTTTLLISLADAYRVSFDWSYSTGDDVRYDPAAYTSSGESSQLTNNGGNQFTQTGTVSDRYFSTGVSGSIFFRTTTSSGRRRFL